MNDRNGKSMDDVLASIRRIVRAEKEGAMAAASGEGPHEGAGGDAGSEEPLVLTPAMRTDGGAASSTDRGGTEIVADTSEALAGQGPAMPDREALRATLRELLREEMSGGGAEEAVRSIIRDELTSGEVGSNISQNVLRLIRAEVAKALQATR